MPAFVSSILRYALLLFLTVAAPLASAVPAVIQVTVSDDLDQLQVVLPSNPDGYRALSNKFTDLTDIDSAALSTDSAISYTAKLQHSGAQWAISQWHGDLRLSDWSNWLAVPENWEPNRPFELEIKLPAGSEVVLPFQRLEATESGLVRYRAYPKHPTLGGLSLMGGIGVRETRFGDHWLRIAVAGKDNQFEAQAVNAVSQVFSTAVDVHGTTPAPMSLVVIIPVPFVRETIPWAHVMRGGGSQVIAYIDHTATAADMLADWTLFHEIAHLYHPYLGGEGRWLSEGLASYFQYRYQVTGGFLSEDEAYRRLMAGLNRGARENEKNGYPYLWQAGRMQTYWTGAAMALEIDSRLKSEDITLAQLMGRFADRHLPVMGRQWSAGAYMSELNRYLELYRSEDSNSLPIVTEAYDRYRTSRQFQIPDSSASTWASED